jgi:hypothetical protein
MAFTMSDFLDRMFGYWKEISQETCDKLGEDAGLFVNAYCDGLEIDEQISKHYSESARQESLVAFEVPGVWKELYWMQFLFLASNYPIVMGRLRFNWEQIFRAYHVDTYAGLHPTDPHLPGTTVDKKHEWLLIQEQHNRLRWPEVIAPALRRFFASGQPEENESRCRSLWDRLNDFVHPSGQLREHLIGETALKLRDGFDEHLARQTLADAREVISLIWLAILYRFPRIVGSLRSDPHVFESFPQARQAMVSLAPVQPVTVGEPNR